MILKLAHICVYDFNGKGELTGCGLHGGRHVPVLFNWSIQYSWLFLK